ncbi:MAG: 3-deoxy-7-phosphoheptulonate synthase [Pseudanabaenaceae cyanobacterium bins.68]|nr:3-deoxy-7-phosphoheptulonate synthase [Pseudanabaenaceae cyanobacterium bins.68]
MPTTPSSLASHLPTDLDLNCVGELKTADLHVVETSPLLSPASLRAQFPHTKFTSGVVAGGRDRIRQILSGDDRRLLVIVGPCSIHDTNAAYDYAQKLAALRLELEDQIELVMRVYFEKPRTTVGWKGLINDPHLDGSFDINYGLQLAREILLEITKLGLPAATELLDPIVPQYIGDMISWTAIGARTTESQTHREMASGLSMPVGFKNGTDGNIEVATNAMISAQQSHNFLGIDCQGLVSIVQTTGNPDGHLVLRGGKGGPNYHPEQIRAIAAKLKAQNLNPKVLIDCSHDNSGKDYTKQPQVLADLTEQIEANQGNAIMGVMVESHLVAGKQSISPQMTYGQSVTDGCVDFDTTAAMLRSLHQANRLAKRVP